MKHHLATSLFGLVLALMVAGCSGNNPESLAKEGAGQFNELVTALENAKTADEVKPKVEAIAARMHDLKKRVDALKMSDADQKKFDATMKAEMEKISGRMSAAMMKLVASDPLGVMKLGEAMKNMAIDKK